MCRMFIKCVEPIHENIWHIPFENDGAINIVIKNLLEVYNVGQILTNCLFYSLKNSFDLHHPRVEADCNFYPLKANIDKIDALASDEKKIPLEDMQKIKSVIKILSEEFFDEKIKNSLSIDQKAEICYEIDKLREKYPL